MRRTPCATPISEVILKSPMSPARRTCVPPHSSTEREPMRITRTVSPYFSPKSATAPDFLASSNGITEMTESAFLRISSFTRSSTRRFSSSLMGAKCAKSKRSRSGATNEPFCATCAPSTSLSARCRRCVAEWLARMASRRATSTLKVRALPGVRTCRA